MRRVAAAAIVGALLGVLDARLVVGSWMSLILWAVVGLMLGAWSKGARPAAVGCAYGFMLSFVFLVAGYTGRSSLASRLPGFLVLAAFGGFCGTVLALLGASARKSQ